jgi:hypothetical protein
MNIFIDVAISMAFVFLLFSIMVSGICEMWQMLKRKRAHFLRESLEDVFNCRQNKNYAHLLYSHPMIDRLKERKYTYPQYIPSAVFADALIDVIRNDSKLPRFSFDHDRKEFVVQHNAYSVDEKDSQGNVLAGTGVVADFTYAVEAMKESDLKQMLRTLLLGVTNYDQLKSTTARWFDDYMASTTTWYKRYLTKVLFISGFAVAVIFNVDAIHLAKSFYKDKLLRERVVDAAIQYTKDENNRPATPEEVNFGIAPKPLPMDSVVKRNVRVVTQAYKEAELLDLPIGWNIERVVGYKKYPYFTGHSRLLKLPWFAWELLKYILLSLTGWLITAAALSYGADYWFNMLSKLISIRTAVKPKEEKK